MLRRPPAVSGPQMALIARQSHAQKMCIQPIKVRWLLACPGGGSGGDSLQECPKRYSMKTEPFNALPPGAAAGPPPPAAACCSSQSTSTWLSRGLRSGPNIYCGLVRLRLGGAEFARIAADAGSESPGAGTADGSDSGQAHR